MITECFISVFIGFNGAKLQKNRKYSGKKQKKRKKSAKNFGNRLKISNFAVRKETRLKIYTIIIKK